MNTIKFLNSYNDIEQMQTLRQKLFSMGICWTDSIKGKFASNDSFRAILYLRTSNNQSLDYNNPMINECNGLVVEYANNSWKLLVAPMHNFNKNKVSIHQINEYYQSGKYDLYEMLDATIINLYHYEGSWRIATTKGYDVGSFEFVDGLSYNDVFMRIISENYQNFTFDSLSKDYCYSIALRFNKYHLFDETKHVYAKNACNNYLYVIQSYNLNTKKVNNDLLVGLPYQLPIVIKSAPRISILNDYAKHAYAKYMKAYISDNFKYKPLYGYILRTNHPDVPNAYKNIIISSSLFKIIKIGLYKNRGTSNSEIIVKLFLDNKFKESNAILFDQFSTQLDKLKTTMMQICEDAQSVIEANKHISNNELITNCTKQLVNDLTANGFLEDRAPTISVMYDYLHSLAYAQYMIPLIDA